MTNEEMFNKNINIAYKIANKYLINYANEYEDIKQVALMGLWKAVLTFNNRHAFSTYAYTVISNEINYYLRTTKKHYNTISLKQEIGEKITLEDVLADKNNYIEKSENNLDIENYITQIRNSKLKEQEKIVFELSLKGYKQDKIAKTVGCSQPTVGRIIRRLREKIKL